jgi:hypothetical protein
MQYSQTYSEQLQGVGLVLVSLEKVFPAYNEHNPGIPEIKANNYFFLIL